MVQTTLDDHINTRWDRFPFFPNGLCLIYYLMVHGPVENEMYIGMCYVHLLKARLNQHRRGTNCHTAWPNLVLIKTEGPMTIYDAKQIERERILEYRLEGIPLANSDHVFTCSTRREITFPT